MTALLNFGRDVQGYNAYAPNDASYKWNATLQAGAASSITVPNNYPVWIVAFSSQPGMDVWVDMTGATAAIPVGSTLAATTSSLNPGQRTLLAGANISVITDDTTADICIEMWPIGLP